MFDRKINTQTDSQLPPFPTHTQVEGAEVTVYRIRAPVLGDAPGTFAEGVLDAPIATPEVIMQRDCVVIGGPGRQGRMSAEVSYFFDSLTEFQTNGCLL